MDEALAGNVDRVNQAVPLATMGTNPAAGARIRELRRCLSLSQAQLAAEVGLAVSTIHLSEKHGPTARVAAQLAPILGCKADDLT